HRLRLVEAGQIMEVTVLPVRVLDVVVAVAHRRRGQDGDGIAPHDLQQRPPAACELGAKVLSARARGSRDRWRRAPGGGSMADQCRGAPGDEGRSLRGSSSSKMTCTLTRTNSTSSA